MGEGKKSAPPLGRQFVESLLVLLAERELNDQTYALHMESMAALLVCVSTQMFCDLSSTAPQPLAAAVLSSEAGIASRVVMRLLQHYTRRPAPPKEAIGLFRAISSAAGFVFYLPWQVFSYFFRPANSPPLELGDRSLQARHNLISMRSYQSVHQLTRNRYASVSCP